MLSVGVDALELLADISGAPVFTFPASPAMLSVGVDALELLAVSSAPAFTFHAGPGMLSVVPSSDTGCESVGEVGLGGGNSADEFGDFGDCTGHPVTWYTCKTCSGGDISDTDRISSRSSLLAIILRFFSVFGVVDFCDSEPLSTLAHPLSELASQSASDSNDSTSFLRNVGDNGLIRVVARLPREPSK